MRPVTIVAGHYGVGKTNFALNLALDSAAMGYITTLVDLDVVNPYFRASEYRALLEQAGVGLVAPMFSEATTNLDVPALCGAIEATFVDAGAADRVIVDLGGDDVGSVVLGRFAQALNAQKYAFFYLLNRHRYQVADTSCALDILRKVQDATHLKATALVDNAHMKGDTDVAALADTDGYTRTIENASGLPLVAKTIPQMLLDAGFKATDVLDDACVMYPVKLYVKNPWE